MVSSIIKSFRKVLGSLVNTFASIYRDPYRMIRKKRLSNTDFTIISNNCCAGIIYHDLKERFTSPTINLSIPGEYYFEFLNHLEYYIHAEPQQVFHFGTAYPVGRIVREDKEIYIHFMHYGSFSEACEKWLERGKRVYMDNIYVIFNSDEPNHIEQFLSSKYTHKAMLTNCQGMKYIPDCIYHMPVYSHSNQPGILLRYKSLFSVHRWLDDFDYISFLNQK